MLDQSNAEQNSFLEFVTFTSGGQSFCLEIKQIREIRRWTPVTALPHAPDDVLGVMNLRGAVIPIYDLAARFGLVRTEISERNVIIIVSVSGQTFGLVVSSVSEILSVSADKIQDTPHIKSENTRQSILGVISIAEEMTRVVDLQSVLGGETGSGT